MDRGSVLQLRRPRVACCGAVVQGWCRLSLTRGPGGTRLHVYMGVYACRGEKGVFGAVGRGEKLDTISANMTSRTASSVSTRGQNIIHWPFSSVARIFSWVSCVETDQAEQVHRETLPA